MNEIVGKDGEITIGAKRACMRVIKNAGAPSSLQNDSLCHYALLVIFVRCAAKNIQNYFMNLPALNSAIGYL